MMEVNTRLQVEHPVTEAVTGIDLVEWQLRVAQGEELPLTQDQIRFAGHAIEVRLCAEDEDFHPHTGRVRHFRSPSSSPPGGSMLSGEGIRFDHAIHEGLVVSPLYDSLLGKLVAHAPTRDEAIAQLAAALDGTQLLGLATNRRLLAACLRHPQFRSGRARIPFLAEQGDALRAELHDAERAMAVSGALAAVYGCRPNPSAALRPPFARPLRLRHRGEVLSLRVRELADGALEVQRDGQSERVTLPPAACVRLDDGRWHVQIGAVDLFVHDASFEPAGRDDGSGASELRAPFNGKVIAVQAQAGRAVTRGETLLVLESMKLEHALAAVRDGVIDTVQAEPGQQAATGQVLVTFRSTEPAKS